MSTYGSYSNPPTYGTNPQPDGSKQQLTIIAAAIVVVLIGCIIWLSFFRSENKEIETPISDNSYESVKDEIRETIKKALSIRKINTILVADYLNLDNEQDKFGKYLGEDFSALFTRGSNFYRVIERSRLNILLEEQDLSAAGLLDQQTVSELGQIIGVQAVITGKYQIVGSYLKLWIKVIDIEKSELLLTKEVRIYLEGEIKDAIEISN